MPDVVAAPPVPDPDPSGPLRSSERRIVMRAYGEHLYSGGTADDFSSKREALARSLDCKPEQISSAKGVITKLVNSILIEESVQGSISAENLIVGAYVFLRIRTRPDVPKKQSHPALIDAAKIVCQRSGVAQHFEEPVQKALFNLLNKYSALGKKRNTTEAIFDRVFLTREGDGAESVSKWKATLALLASLAAGSLGSVYTAHLGKGVEEKKIALEKDKQKRQSGLDALKSVQEVFGRRIKEAQRLKNKSLVDEYKGELKKVEDDILAGIWVEAKMSGVVHFPLSPLVGEDRERLEKLFGKAEEYLVQAEKKYDVVATVLMSLGRYQEAFELQKKVFEIDPDNPSVIANYAIALEKIGRREEAIVLMQDAIHREPDYGLHYYNLGVFYSNKKDLRSALRAYNKAIENGHRDASVYYNKGTTLQKLCRFAEACDAFRESIHQDPKPETYINLGIVLQELGKLEESAEILLKAIELDPEDPVAHNNFSITLLKQKKYAEAGTFAQKACELDPDNEELAKNLIVILGKGKDFSAAIMACERYVEKFGNRPNIVIDYAYFLLEEKRYEKALFVSRRAVRLDPKNPLAFCRLGLAFLYLKRFGESEKAYKMALKIDPGFQIAQSGLKLVEKARGYVGQKK